MTLQTNSYCLFRLQSCCYDCKRGFLEGHVFLIAAALLASGCLFLLCEFGAGSVFFSSSSSFIWNIGEIWNTSWSTVAFENRKKKTGAAFKTYILARLPFSPLFPCCVVSPRVIPNTLSTTRRVAKQCRPTWSELIVFKIVKPS